MQRDSISNFSYGVILFENDKSPRHGWACISNSEPFYFRTFKELNQNVIWFCNLSISCLENSDLYSYLTIKPSDYLFSQFHNLRAELGLFNRSDVESIKVLCGVFEAVMVFHEHYIGANKIPRGSLLNQNIKSVFGGFNFQECELIKKFKDEMFAGIKTIKNSWLYSTEVNHKTLLFHRFEYARNIISRHLPIGQWTQLSNTILNIGQHSLHKWILTCLRPLILNVDVTFNDDTAKKLFHLNRTSQSPTWVTIDEYKWLSNYASIIVKSAFICEGYAPFPFVLPEYTHEVKSSYSFGLYCENIWTSICMESNGELDRSMSSFWTLALDRVQCLQKSYQLEKETSLTVIAYAFGRVIVLYPNAVDGYLCRSAFTSDLISPMPIPSVSFQRTVPDNPSLSQFMQIVIERSAIGFLQQLDDVALIEIHELTEKKSILNNEKFQVINLR